MRSSPIPQIWLGPCMMFVPPKFKGVLFNPRLVMLVAYCEGRAVMSVDWIRLYQAMGHPIGRQVFRNLYGSLPGQWLLEAVFP